MYTDTGGPSSQATPGTVPNGNTTEDACRMSAQPQDRTRGYAGQRIENQDRSPLISVPYHYGCSYRNYPFAVPSRGFMKHHHSMALCILQCSPALLTERYTSTLATGPLWGQ